VTGCWRNMPHGWPKNNHFPCHRPAHACLVKFFQRRIRRISQLSCRERLSYFPFFGKNGRGKRLDGHANFTPETNGCLFVQREKIRMRILPTQVRALNPCNLKIRKALKINWAIVRFMGRGGAAHATLPAAVFMKTLWDLPGRRRGVPVPHHHRGGYIALLPGSRSVPVVLAPRLA
jgi:hypothetical protein